MQFAKFDLVFIFKIVVYPQQAETVKWLRAALEEQFGGEIVAGAGRWHAAVERLRLSGCDWAGDG